MKFTNTSTFPGVEHVSIGSFEEAKGRTITIGSFSKSHALTGWRVGYMHMPRKLTEEVLKVHDTFFICAPTPSQKMAIRALEIGTDFLSPYRTRLYSRMNLLREQIKKVPHLHWREPKGALFALLRFSVNANPSQLAMRILDEVGVALVPGDAFGSHGSAHLRISFGASDENDIARAGKRLSEFFRTSNVSR
ncbi:MAG: pyridoxal phosphate-dependent aminotransferase [Planctomycetota bacterium]|nr:pyridoxal phosphate-dependent aminotransferase [Planctomycetota bacterium]